MYIVHAKKNLIVTVNLSLSEVYFGGVVCYQVLTSVDFNNSKDASIGIGLSVLYRSSIYQVRRLLLVIGETTTCETCVEQEKIFKKILTCCQSKIKMFSEHLQSC